MKFVTVSTWQLIVMTVLMSVLTASLVSINTWYATFIEMPKVYIDNTGACVRVQNFNNGESFTCEDVDILLRRYRKSHE
jgi:hypothetical protein